MMIVFFVRHHALQSTFRVKFQKTEERRWLIYKYNNRLGWFLPVCNLYSWVIPLNFYRFRGLHGWVTFYGDRNFCHSAGFI